jgi:lipoate-protein ligase A
VNVEYLGYSISWETAADAFCSAFEEVLNLRLVESRLLPEESRRAAQLVEQKYANPTWTYRI